MLPVADGLALAAQLKGTRQVAATFTGDGATSEGDFHEAVNLAAVWKLPVLFVIENNQYGLSTPVAEQYACRDLADRGLGYGIPGVVVDGNDLLAVHRGGGAGGGARAARARARRCSSSRPSACAATRRPRAPPTCRQQLFEEWARQGPRGPVRGTAGRARRADARPSASRCARTLKARDRRARGRGAGRARPRSPPRSAELADVFAPSAPRRRRRSRADAAAAPELRYVDAISDGLREAMRARPAAWSCSARTSPSTAASSRSPRASSRSSARRACATRRSSSRARSAPPSAWPSTASGPWSRCSSATSSPAASTRSSTTWPRRTTAGARAVPVVRARRRWAAAWAPGPFHSQNVEAWFTHVAGLKVVAPATPSDAKGLLLAAVRGRQPRPLPRAQAPLPLGEGAACPPGCYTRAARPGARRPRRARRHRRDLRRRRVVGAGGRRARLAARGPRDRGRSTCARSCRGTARRCSRRCARRAARWSCTRRPLTGGFGGEMAAMIGARGLRVAGRAGRAAGRRSTCRSRSARRSRRSSPRRAGCDRALEELLKY